MKNAIGKIRFNHLIAAGALAFAIGTASAWAQDETSTSVTHGEPAMTTSVKNATIVYVEGNNLVLRLRDGRVEHLIVPFNETFQVDGKEVTVRDLIPGTHLTQTVTTTNTPHYVTTVRTLKGKVWHVNAPNSVILALPDGTNQIYNVPSHAKFKINGQEKTVFELRKGMKLEATIITDSRESVVASNKVSVGESPLVLIPHLADVLLFETPHPAVIQAPETTVSAEEPPALLPQTASSLPLAGAMGVLSLAAAFSLGAMRKGLAYFRS
jgi:hypothetical protein